MRDPSPRGSASAADGFAGQRIGASWVLDTNVIVSGILNPHGYPGKLVDAVFSGLLRLTLDDRILLEYRQVLSRPRFKIAPEQLAAIMTLFMRQDVVTPAPLGVKLPDPDDLPFLECAKFAIDGVLVTGNTKHYLRAARHGVMIVTPTQAWRRLVDIA